MTFVFGITDGFQELGIAGRAPDILGYQATPTTWVTLNDLSSAALSFTTAKNRGGAGNDALWTAVYADETERRRGARIAGRASG